MSDIKLYQGDCLELMKDISDKSIDMILCDLPYGTTVCRWDIIIPFDRLWDNYNRIIKDDGAIVLFGTEPFSSKLRLSNLSMYKYDYVWVKNRVGNFLNCKNSPLKEYEIISVFSKGSIANGSKVMMRYYPQGLKDIYIYHKTGNQITQGTITNRPCREGPHIQTVTNYPKNILKFDCDSGSHPTQKPVALCEYLIKTYTNKGDIVLDNCMGSGSTGVACKKLGRHFIGIEKDKEYFETAKKRIQETTTGLI